MTKRICKYCKSEYEIKTGLHNWKNLFRKPTIDEWVMLIILLMSLYMAWNYHYELKERRSYYEETCPPRITTLNPEIQYITIKNEGVNNSFIPLQEVQG